MPLSTQDLKDIIVNDATRLGNAPALMLALADHESRGFNPNALSPTGVRGLFQVTNKTGGPYGQTPQTRSDPTVSSDVGQRHFKDLLHKAGGNVDTALTWYNGGSDPQFARRVQAKVAGHRATLTADPSPEELHQAVYGTTPAAPPAAAPEADPSPEELHQAVYGTPTPEPPAAAATPAAEPHWYERIANALHGAMPAVPARTYPLTPPRGAGPDPDLPLEESVNPLELGISGYGAKVTRGVAQALAPKAGRLVQMGAEGLGLELGHKVNQATGQTPGSITSFGWPDVANFTTPLVVQGAIKTGQAVLPYTRAGRAVQTATKATAAEEASYASRLREAEAAQAQQAAADRMRLMPDGSVPPATPVPQTLQSLRSSPPTPVESTLPPPQLSSAAKKYFGFMPSWVAPVAGTVDSVDALISHALNSPTLRPWLERQLAASGGTLTPQTLATLNAVVRGAVPAEAPPPAGP
jgi:hypothetical protein